MRTFIPISARTLVATASLLVLAACGGGSDAPADGTAGAGGGDTGSTTTTAATTSTTAAATTTTTASTTTTTLPPFETAAATLVIQHSGLCLGVTDSANGGNVRQVPCAAGNPALNWEVKAAAGGYTFRNLQSNLCMRVNDATLVEPSYVVQNTCDGSANTRWTFQPSAEPGLYNLTSALSSLCLDVIASDITPGKELIQYTCNLEQRNQHWQFNRVAP